MNKAFKRGATLVVPSDIPAVVKPPVVVST
jgi:hypothetical protein